MFGSSLAGVVRLLLLEANVLVADCQRELLSHYLP
jgi:hypothetical protein